MGVHLDLVSSGSFQLHLFEEKSGVQSHLPAGSPPLTSPAKLTSGFLGNGCQGSRGYQFPLPRPAPRPAVQEPPAHAQSPWCNAGVSSAPAPSLREGAGAMSHLLFSLLLPPSPPSPELMVAPSFSGACRPQALKTWAHLPLGGLRGCN